MVDVETIREHYAAMPDFKLLQIAEEGSELTNEAFIILKNEIKKRGLNTDVINQQQEIRIENNKEKIRANLRNSVTEYKNKIWTLALDSKQQGMTDEEIQRSLIKEGLMPEDAANIVMALPQVAQFLLKDAKAAVSAENLWLLFVVVLMIAMICVGMSFWGLYAMGAVRCIAAGVRMSAASRQKTKAEEIIAVIEKEKEAEPMASGK